MIVDSYFFVFLMTSIMILVLVLPIVERVVGGVMNVYTLALISTTLMFLLFFVLYMFQAVENYRFRQIGIRTYANVIDFDLKQNFLAHDKNFIKISFFDNNRINFITVAKIDSSTWNLLKLEPSIKLEILYLSGHQGKVILANELKQYHAYVLTGLSFIALLFMRFIWGIQQTKVAWNNGADIIEKTAFSALQ